MIFQTSTKGWVRFNFRVKCDLLRPTPRTKGGAFRVRRRPISTLSDCARQACYIPKTETHPKGLLIDESVIPEAWIVSMYSEPSSPFGWEFETVYFNSPYGGGIQDIYREGTKQKAHQGYDDLVESQFHPHCEPPEWNLPSEITYQSPVADYMQLGCSTTYVTGREDCRFIAQYGVYVVEFDATISEVMTYADFEAVLQDIDRRMTECLVP